MATFEAIPETMRAQVLNRPGGEVQFTSSRPVPAPSTLKAGQCLVKLSHSGVCHSDLGIAKDIYPKRGVENLVGGHEGIGIIVAIGDHTTDNHVKLGDRVGVTFIASTCNHCEMCLRGAEPYCYKAISGGYDVDGTFAEYVLANMNNVIPIPDALDSAAAASFMCAGITVYSAVKRTDALVGDWVVIPGAGGGLGHLAVQYAVAVGYRVVAIDTGEEKKTTALGLGAERFIDFRVSKDVVADVIAATDGLGAHAALVAADADLAYQQASQYLRPYGTLVAVGLPPTAVIELPVMRLTAFGITVRGTKIGSRKEFQEALTLAAAGRVKVKFEVRGLSELPQIYEELSKGKIVGRVVMDISK